MSPHDFELEILFCKKLSVKNQYFTNKQQHHNYNHRGLTSDNSKGLIYKFVNLYLLDS